MFWMNSITACALASFVSVLFSFSQDAVIETTKGILEAKDWTYHKHEDDIAGKQDTRFLLAFRDGKVWLINTFEARVTKWSGLASLGTYALTRHPDRKNTLVLKCILTQTWERDFPDDDWVEIKATEPEAIELWLTLDEANLRISTSSTEIVLARRYLCDKKGMQITKKTPGGQSISELENWASWQVRDKLEFVSNGKSHGRLRTAPPPGFRFP